VTFFSLQKDRSERLSFEHVDLAPQLTDMDDTAAVLQHLDLLISVDTAVVHLAGALGRPVWTLLHYSPDWRWMLDREDTPWYPTMRLFRQRAYGDWAGVAARVAEGLSKLAETSPK
jgi:ADP-heptose:LPS heptosyltransferase